MLHVDDEVDWNIIGGCFCFFFAFWEGGGLCREGKELLVAIGPASSAWSITPLRAVQTTESQT